MDDYQIQVGSHKITVTHCDASELEEMEDEGKVFVFGEYVAHSNKIRIANDLSPSRYLSTLVHEVEEAARELYADYEIPHRDICVTGEAIVQAMTSNPQKWIQLLGMFT